MSQENIELLHRGYAALNEHNSAVLLEMLSPNFVYHPRSELPGNEPRVGRAQFEHALDEFWESFTVVRADVDEIIDGGDVIVAVVHETGQGRLSGLAIDVRVVHVWRFEGDKVSELSVYSSRADALEAAGLSE